MTDSNDTYATTAEFYDQSYRSRADVGFYVDLAREAAGPVFEIGCGTGRLLIPVARAGCEITGLDLSPAMLQICREQVAHEAPEVRARVKLIEADMRSFDLTQKFSLITIPFRAFQHLTSVDDQLQCLRTMRRHLDPRGRFVLDIFNPSLPRLVAADTAEFEDSPEETLADGRRVSRTARIAHYDSFAQINRVVLTNHIKHPDGREEHIPHEFDMRYLFRYEAEHLLARSGFEVEQVLADYNRAPYGSRSPGELIILARAI